MHKKLPVVTKIVVDSVAFDKLVEEEFGVPYSSQRALDYAGQETIHSIDIEQEVADEEYARKEYTWEERKRYELYLWEDWFSEDTRAPLGNYEDLSDRSPMVGVVCAKLRERGWTVPDKFDLRVWW
jgi:hypothetical protein